MNPNFSDKAKRDFLLVERAKVGDQTAFAELLGYYRESLFYMLNNMVQSKEDAEDLTIETFEKAFRKIDKYKPLYAFSTWLFRIATNHGIDFIRSKNRNPENIYIDDEDDFRKKVIIPEKSENPEEEIVKEQRNQLLKKIVQKLPIDYKNVVVSRYFNEMSYGEISDQLQLPLGTVKARLHRSRTLLQTIIEKHNIHDTKL